MRRLVAELKSERFSNRLLFENVISTKKAVKCLARVSYSHKELEKNVDFLFLSDTVISNYLHAKSMYTISCRKIKKLKRRINNEQKNISYKKN